MTKDAAKRSVRTFYEVVKAKQRKLLKAMSPLYARIRQQARYIVSRFPQPAFYRDFARSVSISRKIFQTDPLLQTLFAFVSKYLDEDLGHGQDHAIKVAIDAGALMLIEGIHHGYSETFAVQRAGIVQSAGLLHDIKRKMKNHAMEGAIYARQILQSYSYEKSDIEDISQAIRNHEAFQPEMRIDTLDGALVSDCLYDADKFRWGPDNFMDTVWDMVSYYNLPLSDFLARYPRSMEKIASIKRTFRTGTGQMYGPEFIDIGIAIGKELLKYIQAEFACED